MLFPGTPCPTKQYRETWEQAGNLSFSLRFEVNLSFGTVAQFCRHAFPAATQFFLDAFARHSRKGFRQKEDNALCKKGFTQFRGLIGQRVNEFYRCNCRSSRGQC